MKRVFVLIALLLAAPVGASPGGAAGPFVPPTRATGGGSVAGAGTSPDLARWTSSGTLGNYAGSSPAACSTGQSLTQVALAATGVVSDTCSTVLTTPGTGLATAGAGDVHVNLTPTSCVAGTGLTAISAAGAGTCTGDVTSVVAGTSITTSTTSGAATVNVNLPGGTCAAGNVASALSSSGSLTCTPIGTQGGTTGAGTATDLAIWSSSTGLGNYAGSSPSACGAGNATTGVAISAAGGLTNTCSSLATLGAAAGTGTSGTSTRWIGTATIGNGSWGDTGAALSTTVPVTLGGQIIQGGVITPTAFASGTTVNDYGPPGLSGASVIVQQCNGATASTITGLVAQPTNTVITIVNPLASTAPLLLTSQNVGSLAANRTNMPANTTWQIDPGYSMTIRYTGSSDWEVLTAYVAQFPGLTVTGISNLGQIRYTTQLFSTTGTSNSVTVNSSTTVFKYTGAGTATITGFVGGAPNRILYVFNGSSSALTLANLNGGSTSGQQLQDLGGVDTTLGSNESAIYLYDSTTNGPWHMIATSSATQPAATSFPNAKNGGTITLAAGTGTATVTAGSHCVCSDTTANVSVKCALSSTTLTATGTTTDVISYLCF